MARRRARPGEYEEGLEPSASERVALKQKRAFNAELRDAPKRRKPRRQKKEQEQV